MTYTLVVKEYMDYVIPYITIIQSEKYTSEVGEGRALHEADRLRENSLFASVKLFEDDEETLSIYKVTY